MWGWVFYFLFLEAIQNNSGEKVLAFLIDEQKDDICKHCLTSFYGFKVIILLKECVKEFQHIYRS